MKHWIFIANDKDWDWRTDQKVGEIANWPADGKKIPQKISSEIQDGDIVIGYSSGKAKSFVSIGVIEKSLSQYLNKKKLKLKKSRICKIL
jgi:hypothetical protein